MNLLTGFDVAGLMFSWDRGDPQLVSKFLKKVISPCIAVELVCLWEREGLGLPTSTPC